MPKRSYASPSTVPRAVKARRSPASKLRRRRVYRARKKTLKKARKIRVSRFLKNGSIPTKNFAIFDVNHTIDFNFSSPGSSQTRFYSVNANYFDTTGASSKGLWNEGSVLLMPKGFDLMRTLYQRMRIYACKVSIQFFNYASQPHDHCIIWAFTEKIDNPQRVPVTEQELADSKVIGLKKRTVKNAYLERSMGYLTKGFTEKQMTSDERSENEYDLTQISMTSFSIGQGYRIRFGVTYHTPPSPTPSQFNGANVPGMAKVKVKYYCKFTEPKEFASDFDPDAFVPMGVVTPT